MLDTTVQSGAFGIDLAELDALADAAEADPAAARARFRVTTRWTGRARTESLVESGGRDDEPTRRFKVVADQPQVLLGGDSGPNPQELLVAALNACLAYCFVVQAARHGVSLSDVRIETEREIDILGLLGLDDGVGCEHIDYVVHLDGDGTADQYERIHQAVAATSVNYFSLSRPVRLRGRIA